MYCRKCHIKVRIKVKYENLKIRLKPPLNPQKIKKCTENYEGNEYLYNYIGHLDEVWRLEKRNKKVKRNGSMGTDIPWDEFDWKDKIKTKIKIPYLVYVYLRLKSIADNMNQQDIIVNDLIAYYKLPAPLRKKCKKFIVITEEQADVCA